MDYQRLLETTERLLDLTEMILILRGGKGSGNFGHKGRKGKRGGSGGGGKVGGGSVVISDTEKETANQIYTAFKAIPDSPVYGGPEKYYGMLALLKGGHSLGTIQEMGNLYESDNTIPKPMSLSIKPGVKNAKDVTHEDTVKAYDSWIKNLSDDERLGLGEYQRGDYNSMNDHLRKGDQVNNFQKKRINDAISALGKTSIPQDTILYRGTDTDVYKSQLGNDPKQWVGKTFTDKGFLSSSIDESASFGGLKVKILAPKGTKGGYLGNLPPPHRHNKGEKEMLLAPGTRMRIIGVDIGQTGRLENVTTEIIGQG
jgi:hypothetical protein